MRGLLPECRNSRAHILSPATSYGSQAWQLLPELHRCGADAVITSKRTYDAFQGTELEARDLRVWLVESPAARCDSEKLNPHSGTPQELLHGWGVDTVIVSGCMTHFCSETTAR